LILEGLTKRADLSDWMEKSKAPGTLEQWTNELNHWFKEQGIFEYVIPSPNMPNVYIALEKINKRAKKLNKPEITIEILDTFNKKYKSGFLEFHHILVSGGIPKIGGWSLAATIDSHQDGYLVQILPDQKIPEKYKNFKKIYCDHCTSHRKRKSAFIVKNEKTNEFKVVGSTCLKDFLGHSPQSFLKFWSNIEAINTTILKGEGCFNSILEMYKIKDFLAIVNVIARKNGYISAKTAKSTGKTPTGKKAFYAMADDESAVNSEDIIAAIEMIDMAPSIYNRDDSSYCENLKTIFESDFVAERTANTVASIYSFYQAEQNRKNASEKESDFVGSVGARLRDINLKCVFTKDIINNYNRFARYSQLCKFKDNDGNIFTWFNSGGTEIQLNHNYVLTGTIKKHNEYNNEKQTVLSHCIVD